MNTTSVGEHLYGVAANAMSVLSDVTVVNGVVMLPRDITHENNLAFADHAVLKNKRHIAWDFADKLSKGSIKLVANENIDDATQIGNLGARMISGDKDLADFAEWDQRAANKAAHDHDHDHDPGGDDGLTAFEGDDSMRTPQLHLLESLTATAEFQQLVSKYPVAPVQLNGKKVTKRQGDMLDAQRKVIACFNSGLANAAILNFKPTFLVDTHQDHDKYHAVILRETFAVFSQLITTLKTIQAENSPSKRSLFECTTVVMYSEFARGPFRERKSGTAHNPYSNSYWLTGGRIKGGVKIGASDIVPGYAVHKKKSLLQGLPFDFNSFRSIPLAEWASQYSKSEDFCAAAKSNRCLDFLTPSNVWATVAESMGIRDTSVQGAKIIKPILR